MPAAKMTRKEPTVRKIGPRENYHAEESRTPAVLPALRELLSRHSNLADSGPEGLQLALRGYLPGRPDIYEVEAALEALCVEGQVVA